MCQTVPCMCRTTAVVCGDVSDDSTRHSVVEISSCLPPTPKNGHISDPAMLPQPMQWFPVGTTTRVATSNIGQHKTPPDTDTHVHHQRAQVEKRNRSQNFNHDCFTFLA
ncbi:unnamed protein product [Ectocarpus sp. 13 AM-2016]